MLRVIRQEISPALGCTEPVAAALCAAGAASVLPGAPQRIALEASEYILKNAMNVGIPGTDAVGLEAACALGAAAAAPEKGLLVLEGLTAAQKSLAEALAVQGRITVSKAETREKVYLRAVAECGVHRGEAVISGSHSHFSSLLRDGRAVPLAETALESERAVASAEAMTIAEIWAFIQETEEEELCFLEEAAALLEGGSLQVQNFGQVHYYQTEDLVRWAPGLEVRQVLGVRILFGLPQDNAAKEDPAWQQAMLRLEAAAAGREPYRQMAFFHHVLLRPRQSPPLSHKTPG